MALGCRTPVVKRRLAARPPRVYTSVMLDRLYLPILGCAAALAIALAMVWPQGLGDRSPAPFGHEPIQRTPEIQAKMKRETEAAAARVNQARDAVRDLQTPSVAPTQ